MATTADAPANHRVSLFTLVLRPQNAFQRAALCYRGDAAVSLTTHLQNWCADNNPRCGLAASSETPPLITAAIDWAQRLSEPYLFNRAMRSWLFAEAVGRTRRIVYDHEVVAVGTILHDIGLTASVSGPSRFEVDGADAVRSFVGGSGSRFAVHN
jgi:hypothetical protein